MAVSREEYLKKYLSGPTQEKKKSKKKTSKAVIRKAGLKILDDDVDFKSLLPNNIKNSLDDDLADDNPVVIDLGLDDRPEQIKELERMRNSKRWKVVTQDKDDGEHLRQSELEEEIRKERGAVKKSFEDSNSSSDMRKNEKRRYDSESDASPTRLAHDEATIRRISPTRKRLMADSGTASSVRTTQRERNLIGNDASIEKRKRQDSMSGSDKSPPRQRQDSSDGSDNSPKRRRLDSTGSVDNSPPRQMQGRKASSNTSSPRRKRKDFADYADDSSPRRKQSRDPSSDISPPRQKQGRNPSSDNSPPRRKGKDSAVSVNNSPPRRRYNRSTHSDSSPPRRRRDGRADSDSDMSPPRKENKSAFQQKQKKDRTDERQDATNSPQVIYRKDGKKRDLQAERKLKDEEEAKKAALAAKYKEWNKGLKQKEMVKERVADALNEVAKPLARYKDDRDLDSHLRAQLHDEDPMLAFIKKKKSSAKGAEKPRYRGPQPPPNRFNIQPGYRWDGVDRSNGFEKKFFSKLSEDKAVKDMAYKWSVEDM